MKALERMLAPLRPALFFSRYWEKRHVTLPGRAGRFDDLLTLDRLDELVSTSALRYPALRLVKDGRALPLAEYTYDAPGRDAPYTDTISVDRVLDHHESGATVVAQGLQRWCKPLSRFCRELGQTLSTACKANAYLTPPRSRGLGAHRDPHDVFVLQLHGSKLWRLGTGRARAERLLRRGDALYVPRGCLHEATGLDSASLHLTIGSVPLTWGDLLQEALDGVRDEAPFGRALPPGFAQRAGVAAGLPRRGARLLRAFADRADLAAAAARLAERLVLGSEPALEGRLSGRIGARLPRLSSRVRHASGASFRLKPDEEGVALVLAGHRRLVFPARVASALRYVVSTPSFAVGSIPGGLDDEGRRTLTRRLLREGVLESARP